MQFTKLITLALLGALNIENVQAATYSQLSSVRKVLESDKTFSEDIFKQILARNDLNHLLLSDVQVLVMQLMEEFPEFIKVRSIGKSWFDRKILMFEIDARDHILSQRKGGEDTKELLKEKPAILLTGAHHAREVMSVQLPLYAMLKMLHGYVHNDKHYVDLLLQNKYYVIPVVNVDGLGWIEEEWTKNKVLKNKRKNMNPTLNKFNLCDDFANTGVDLNRNYAVDWHKPGGNSPDPCAESYRGTAPFSEPETRAIRDFLISH